MEVTWSTRMRTPNKEGTRRALRALPLLLAAAFLLSADCKSKEAQPAAAPEAAQTSAIRVSTDADGIHVDTPAAEFLLRRTGYLQASLKSESKMLTLEDPGGETGQQIIAGRTVVSDFVFDLAKVDEATGKLGRLGKHIEVLGTSVGTGLEERVTLEVYDDLPALALLSASLRNVGKRDVTLSHGCRSAMAHSRQAFSSGSFGARSIFGFCQFATA
jgi:hypothetical protein